MNSGDGFDEYNPSFEPVTQKDSIQQGNTPIVNSIVSKTSVDQSNTSVGNKTSHLHIKNKPKGFYSSSSTQSNLASITHDMVQDGIAYTPSITSSSSQTNRMYPMLIVDDMPDIYYPEDDIEFTGGTLVKLVNLKERQRQSSKVTIMTHCIEHEDHMSYEDVMKYRDDFDRPIHQHLKDLLNRENGDFFRDNSYVIGDLPSMGLVVNMCRVFTKWYTLSVSNTISTFSDVSSSFTDPSKWNNEGRTLPYSPIYASFVYNTFDQSFSGEAFDHILACVVTFMKRLTIYLLTDPRWYSYDSSIVQMMKHPGDNIRDFTRGSCISKEVSEFRLMIMTLNACGIPHLFVPLNFDTWGITSFSVSMKHDLSQLVHLHNMINISLQEDGLCIVVIKENVCKGPNNYSKFVLLKITSRILVKMCHYKSDMSLLKQYIHIACCADNFTSITKFQNSLTHRKKPLPTLMAAYMNTISASSSQTSHISVIIEMNDLVWNKLTVQVLGNKQLVLVPGKMYDDLPEYHQNLGTAQMLNTFDPIDKLTIAEFSEANPNSEFTEDHFVFDLYVQKEINKIDCNPTVQKVSKYNDQLVHSNDDDSYCEPNPVIRRPIVIKKSVNTDDNNDLINSDFRKPIIVKKSYNNNDEDNDNGGNKDLTKTRPIVEKSNKAGITGKKDKIVVVMSDDSSSSDSSMSDSDYDLQELVKSNLPHNSPAKTIVKMKYTFTTKLNDEFPIPSEDESTNVQIVKLNAIIRNLIRSIANSPDYTDEEVAYKTALTGRLDLCNKLIDSLNSENKTKSEASKVIDTGTIPITLNLTPEMGVCNWSVNARVWVNQTFNYDFLQNYKTDAYNDTHVLVKRINACGLIKKMIPISFSGRLNDAKYNKFDCPVKLIKYVVKYTTNDEEIMSLNRIINGAPGPKESENPVTWLADFRNAHKIIGKYPKFKLIWLNMKASLPSNLLKLINTDLNDEPPSSVHEMCEEVLRCYTRFLGINRSGKKNNQLSDNVARTNTSTTSKSKDRGKSKDARGDKPENNHSGTRCRNRDSCVTPGCMRWHARDGGPPPVKASETKEIVTPEITHIKKKHKHKEQTPSV